ncbi:ankyrin repeat domain-containing protein [Streptomyces sp. NPDC048445]|uniref:ankyrin repeat domain-containing protein n=1 Tax=Streptomyces sp. NPDC048445 TaxID=3365553 RepID=UPI0037206396
MNALDQQLLDAARAGDTDSVRTAIEGGARVDVRDEELRTPLLLAVHGDHESPWLATGVTGSVPMLHALLPAGPDLKLRNRFGGIALIPASERGHVAYVRELLRVTDIDVDHVNRLGWTALLEAVILGDGGRAHRQIVELLLAAGATPGLPDGDGGTALEHAERRGFAEIAALLRDTR